jgi:hypothetical protein
MALFAVEPGARKFTREQLLAAQRIGSSAEWAANASAGTVKMLPYSALENEHYRLYQQV